MTIHVMKHGEVNPYPGVVVSTTLKRGMMSSLSPFILGPIQLPIGQGCPRNFENFWQFSKVYKEHLDRRGYPNREWFRWKREGFDDPKAHRYPMGKGRKPEYTWWGGQKLGYILARKRIYARLYAENVVDTEAYETLWDLHDSGKDIILKDFDAYDHIKLGMSLKDVINCETKIMGHAFVLAMMLEYRLKECLEE